MAKLSDLPAFAAEANERAPIERQCPVCTWLLLQCNVLNQNVSVFTVCYCMDALPLSFIVFLGSNNLSKQLARVQLHAEVLQLPARQVGSVAALARSI